MNQKITRRVLLRQMGAAGIAVTTVALDTSKVFAAKPTFQNLWANYPLGTASQVNKMIGGKVALNNFPNTCTIRMSCALNRSGDFLPKPFTANRDYGMEVISGSDKLWYAYRVREFHVYMTKKYGRGLTYTKSKPKDDLRSKVVGKRGVIEFVVNGWSDATGHFDVWDGKRCKYAEYFSQATQIYFWAF